jgi:hypothetical protein
VELVASTYAGRGRAGDFTWMIDQPEYADALFVFNDNEEQFLAYRRDPSSGAGCAPGGGNAAIRPYRGATPPRAVGIPTGRRGHGYAGLTPEVRRVIDDAIEVLKSLLASGRYQRVVYSAADAEGTLGSGIFEIGADVKALIVSQLRAAVAPPA